jgi:hypothetical protein
MSINEFKSKLMTPKETALVSRRGQSTLAKERMEGTGIPYIKLGNKILYRTEDVEAFLQANRVETTPKSAA